MIKETKTFTYIVSSDEFIRVPAQYATESKSAILWNKNGLFGLIPFAKIQNLYDSFKGEYCTMLCLAWQGTISCSSTVARLLLGEDEDDQCTYGTKSRG